MRAQPRFSQGGITLCQTESTHQFSPPEYCSARGVLLDVVCALAWVSFWVHVNLQSGFFFFSGVSLLNAVGGQRVKSLVFPIADQPFALLHYTVQYHVSPSYKKNEGIKKTFLPGKFGSREGLLVYLEGGADPDF